MREISVSDNKEALKASLAQKEYDKFFQRYVPHRHRIGIKMYERLKERSYKWDTIQKINQMIDQFEKEFGDQPDIYMCIYGLTYRDLVYLAVDGNGYAIKYGNHQVKPSSTIESMNKKLDDQKPAVASEILGAFGGMDFRESTWYKQYGKGYTVPMEASEKTTMTHMTGEPYVTVNSDEPWAVEWIQKIAAKHDGIIIDRLEAKAVTARLPLAWMGIYNKDAALPRGAGRLDKLPDAAITPPDGPCTVYEHLGGCGTATAYVSEPWSQTMFGRYARMFVRSVCEIPSPGEGNAYYFPAGWMKLPPPNQRSQAIIREAS